MDRRDTLRWMMAAAALPAMGADAAVMPPAGYGTDPNLVKVYRAGTLWPLTMSAVQRATAAALSDTILPADDRSPGAAELQVHVFIDEWISAPYPAHAKDRTMILHGLDWLTAESARRHARPFAEADAAQRGAICDDICFAPRAAPGFAAAATFFARYRDLTAGGFYTTPQGTKDLRFVGNVPLAAFDGPPAEVLRIVGVT